MRPSLSFFFWSLFHQVLANHNGHSWSATEQSSSVYTKSFPGSPSVPRQDRLEGRSQVAGLSTFQTLQGLSATGITWEPMATGSPLTNSIMSHLPRLSVSATETLHQTSTSPRTKTTSLSSASSTTSDDRDAALSKLADSLMQAVNSAKPNFASTTSIEIEVTVDKSTTTIHTTSYKTTYRSTSTSTQIIPATSGICEFPEPWELKGDGPGEAKLLCGTANKQCSEVGPLKSPAAIAMKIHCKSFPGGKNHEGGLQCYRDKMNTRRSMIMGFKWQKQPGCNKDETYMDANFDSKSCTRTLETAIIKCNNPTHYAILFGIRGGKDGAVRGNYENYYPTKCWVAVVQWAKCAPGMNVVDVDFQMEPKKGPQLLETPINK